MTEHHKKHAGETAKIDFIRLASWNLDLYTVGSAILRRKIPDAWEPKSFLQYGGFGKRGVFVGRGKQKGQHHYILSISGSDAGRHYDKLTGIDAYATRIDIERTILAPGDNMLPPIKNKCSRTTVTLIDGYQNDTLYIGNRASDFFVRLYEKVFEDLYLRLELEFKGDRSRAIWRAIKEGVTPDQVYEQMLSRTGLPQSVLKLFENKNVAPTDALLREKLKAESKKKLEWLRKIDGAIYSAMSDHEIGEDVKAIVRSWNFRADELDKLN